MLNVRKFIQAVGISLLLTIGISILLGLMKVENYTMFLFIQMAVTYGSMGYLGAKWNPETPFFAAYLGALTLSILNFLFAYFVMNVMIFFDPVGVRKSISLAVILTLAAALLTVFTSRKKVGAVQ